MKTTQRVVLALIVWAVMVGTVSAITVFRVTVTSTATLMYTSAGWGTVLLSNMGTASVFLGEAAVTTATGFELRAGDQVTLPVGPGDTVYGIVAAGTVVVHGIEGRR